MTELTALWLPIVVSAVLVFVASTVIHMGPFWHRGSYPRLPQEDAVMDALRPFNLPAGDYMFPRGSASTMNTPEFKAKMQRGPVAIITVMPGGVTAAMGRQLATWFVFALVVSLFAGYVASAALSPGAAYLRVFQMTGAVAFTGYSLALWEMSIWYRRGWSLSLKATLDGLIYGLLTAGAFGWLWPV